MAELPSCMKVRIVMPKELRQSMKEVRAGQREVLAAMKEGQNVSNAVIRILADIEGKLRKIEARVLKLESSL